MTREDAIFILECVEAHGIADDAKKCAIEMLKAEPTYEQIKDYCNKHDLVLVNKDLWNSKVLELQTRDEQTDRHIENDGTYETGKGDYE